MGTLLSRKVDMRINNRTQSITLRRARTYFECGSCSKPPNSELGPDCSDNPQFRGSSPFWGVAGVLVYEADSFTLAIYFSNPIDYNKFSMELGLELSLSKAHRGSLESIYTRMATGAYCSSSQDPMFSRVAVKESHGVAELSVGSIRVSATMSYKTSSCLEVVLEEQKGNVRRRQIETL